ncbi:MAG: universal stress protein [Gammaproteobacteria bacterium]
MATNVFRRVVAPTDFSESSKQAWDLTQRLAKALGSEVMLVHVFVEAPVYGDPPAVTTAWEVVVEAQKWVADELERWADQARKTGIDVRTIVLTGSPASEIVRHANEAHADVVIMGTHGRTGLSRVLLGSVAERVIRTAPCPVLTVRTPEPE